MINGAEVDIIDTGIDPTFLEALPDDMREEVLNQHLSISESSDRHKKNYPSQFLPA